MLNVEPCHVKSNRDLIMIHVMGIIKLGKRLSWPIDRLKATRKLIGPTSVADEMNDVQD
jgi:hypothetical protein